MMRIILSCVILLLSVNVVQAEETAPSTHNEYNNSNIYYNSGTNVQQQDDQKDFPIRTFRDPKTGDIVTQVRSRRRNQEQQQVPIIVNPYVMP